MKLSSPARAPQFAKTNVFPQHDSILLDAAQHTICRPKGNVFGSSRDLPVRGRAQGGDEGSLVIEEQPIDWTYRPADLQGVHGAFAVFVTGDSMEPKYKNQDIAYIHPTQPVRRGRYVLVETNGHSGFIKKFERWEGNTLVVKQFNPARDIRIAREDVRRVMMVIGSLDA
ncbi:MAG: helix-turn-helix transcriptional regulator [Kordiimonas sp.]